MLNKKLGIQVKLKLMTTNVHFILLCEDKGILRMYYDSNFYVLFILIIVTEKSWSEFNLEIAQDTLGYIKHH